MRRTADITIATPGRDLGKRFYITEMDAETAVEWADRALLAVSRSGGDVPAGVLQSGFPGLVAFGLQALTTVDTASAKLLMDQVMKCVTVKPDPMHPNLARNLLAGDIEEPATIYKLRLDVFELHAGFSVAAEWLKFRSALAAAQAENTSTTQTSIGTLAA